MRPYDDIFYCTEFQEQNNQEQTKIEMTVHIKINQLPESLEKSKNAGSEQNDATGRGRLSMVR